MASAGKNVPFIHLVKTKLNHTYRILTIKLCKHFVIVVDSSAAALHS